MGLPILEFDNKNIPVLTYIGSNLYINCSRFINNEWVAVGNSNFNSSGFSGFSSNINLCIVQNNDFYVIIDDIETRCFKLDTTNSQWEMVGIAGLGKGLTGSQDLVCDGNSNIYILLSGYNELYNSYETNVWWVTNNGSNWQLLGDSNISESEAGYSCLAHSQKSGKLYCTYNDFKLSKAVVKEFNLITGINNLLFEDLIQIYPNPNDGKFWMRFGVGKSAQYQIQVINVFGQVQFQKEVNLNGVLYEEEFTLSHLPKGNYFIKVSDGRFSNTKKIILH